MYKICSSPNQTTQRGEVGHDNPVLDAEVLSNAICVEKGRQCGQRLESKVSHFALKDHTANNTWVLKVNLEGEKKNTKAKPIGCVYRKYDISHEELSVNWVKTQCMNLSKN